MLQIKNLNLTHKKDLRVILSEFNLVLNKGDKAVIIGEEGNGKSTLMKWIYNPLLIDNYIEAEGERLVGKEILGYLPQEISEEDKEKTIYEFFSAEEMFWNRTPKELSEITGKFGMTSEFFYSDQKMGSLSGGEKVKAHLMRLIIQDVTVLLLDEPSNDIDINTLEILEKIINDWEHIVLFISHDETLIENTANYSLVNIDAEYSFVGKTDEEKSLVCITSDVPPNVIQRDDGWKGFRIQGILDFSLIGILSKIAKILAENSISIFAISTYNTDYVLIKKENYQKALDILKDSGYEIVE